MMHLCNVSHILANVKNSSISHFFRFFLIWLHVVFIVGSCQPKTTEIATYLQVKTAQEKSALNALNQSYASIDVSINLPQYFKKLNDAVPTHFQSANWSCEGVSFELNADRKPINFLGKGSELTFSSLLEYDLMINYCPKCSYLLNEKGTCLTPRIKGSCGIDESKRKAEIGFTTKVDLLADYRFSSSTRLNQVDLIDPCALTIASIDITDRLRKELTTELTVVSEEIDEKIEAVNIMNEVQEAWSALALPISIPSYGYMHLNVNSLGIGTHSFHQNKLNFPIELKATPEFFTATTQKKLLSLPPLSPISERKGYDLTIQLHLGYDSLSSFITEALSKEIISIKNKKIRLDSIRTNPTSNSKMMIDVFFSGDLKGTLKLTGTPCLQDSTQQLFFPDLIHHVYFKKKLFTLLAKMYAKTISNELTAALTIPAAPLLSDLKKEIEQALNSSVTNDIYLSGGVSSINLVHIDATNDYLKAFLRLSGQLKLSH